MSSSPLHYPISLQSFLYQSESESVLSSSKTRTKLFWYPKETIVGQTGRWFDLSFDSWPAVDMIVSECFTSRKSAHFIMMQDDVSGDGFAPIPLSFSFRTTLSISKPRSPFKNTGTRWRAIWLGGRRPQAINSDELTMNLSGVTGHGSSESNGDIIHGNHQRKKASKQWGQPAEGSQRSELIDTSSCWRKRLSNHSQKRAKRVMEHSGSSLHQSLRIWSYGSYPKNSKHQTKTLISKPKQESLHLGLLTPW